MCIKNKMRFKKGMVFLLFSSSIFAQKAEKILKNISNNMQKKEQMYFKFEYVLENKPAKMYQKIQGEIYLQKNKYYIQFGQNILLNNGQKIYNINTEDKEINVMLPSEMDKENILSNPKNFLKAYKKEYDYFWYKKKDKRLQKYTYIQAVPQDKNKEIAYVLIGFDAKKKLIKHFIIVDKNATQTFLELKKIRTDKKSIPPKQFIFDKNFYEKQEYIINES